MMVSVSIITYNHAPFIAQAIESVLMQQTHFPFEVLIGEDDSSDNTRAIVRSYQERYPDRIRLFLNDRKNVIYVDGRPTSRWNLVNNLRHARGKYVALLDGDDYWTDPYKLQKQVDFLEANPDCSMCITPVRTLYQNGEGGEPFSEVHRLERDAYALEDILQTNLAPTCSVLYRNHLFEDFPEWFFQTPSGDWPLFILIAHHGRIGVVDEVTAVYRKHGGSMYSSLEPIEKFNFLVKGRETVAPHLPPHHRAICLGALYTYYLTLSKLYSERGLSSEVKRCAGKCRQLRRYYREASAWDTVKLIYYRLYSPRVDQLLRPVYHRLRAALTP